MFCFIFPGCDGVRKAGLDHNFCTVVSVLIFSPGRSGEIEIFHCAVLTHLGDVILAPVPSKLLTEELAGLHSLLDRS